MTHTLSRANPPTPQPVALAYVTTPFLGSALADQLASQGWRVALCGEAAVEIAAARPSLSVAACSANLPLPSGSQASVDFARERFGRLDLLAYELAAEKPGSLDLFDATPASAESALDAIAASPFFMTQAAARAMIAQRRLAPDFRGRIIYLPPAAERWGPIPSRDAGIASVIAEMLVKLWGARLAEEGIDVYEVRPGGPVGVGEASRRARATADLASGRFTYATGNALTVDASDELPSPTT